MSRPNVAAARRPGHARAVRWRAPDARPWGPGAGVVSPRQRMGGRAAQSERRAGTPAVGRVASRVAVISAGLDLITVLVGFVVIEVGAAKLFSNPCSVSASPRCRKMINERVAQHALLQPPPPPTTPSSNHPLLQPPPPPTTPSSNHPLLQPPPPPTTPSSNHPLLQPPPPPTTPSSNHPLLQPPPPPTTPSSNHPLLQPPPLLHVRHWGDQALAEA